MMAGLLTGNQLVGPAVGAVLFATAMATPFLTWAVCVALGALLVTRMRVTPIAQPAERSHVRRDIRDGFAWTWGNSAVRTLTLTIVTFNVTWGAAWSVLVLYASQRLGLGAVGFGLLNTILAVGGLAGVASHDWLTHHVSLGNIMRAVLLVETLTHLGLALTTTAVGGAARSCSCSARRRSSGAPRPQTVRMRAVPAALQGRVGSLYMIGVYGGLLVGQALGGVIAGIWGVTGPFWFAFAGSALLLAWIWRELRHVADADGPVAAAAPGGVDYL